MEPGEGEDLGEQWFVVVVVDSLGQAQQGLLMLGLSQVEDAGPAGRGNLVEESDRLIRSDLLSKKCVSFSLHKQECRGL